MSDLANSMGHAKATADKYYFMEEKFMSAQTAADKLPMIMRISQKACAGATSVETKVLQSSPSASFKKDVILKLQDVFGQEISNRKINFSIGKRKWLKNASISPVDRFMTS